MNEETPLIIELARALSASMPGGPLGPELALEHLSGGGSDRTFLRVSDGTRTAVLLIDLSGDIEHYVRIRSFLHEVGIAVPDCYGFDSNASAILMEDLGTLHLDEALSSAEAAQRMGLYRQCIATLTEMQTRATEKMNESGFLAERPFGIEALVAETDYFKAEFIGRYCPVPIDDAWEEERLMLARFLASEPRVFMHRDFQSRNLIVKDGAIRIIDFQSAHRGPRLYDAASLLKDPYHPLAREERSKLLTELHEMLEDRGAPVDESFESFYEGFVLAGIQRNLQALAAYVRLGIVKGKRRFLESIPPAIDLLEEGIEESGKLPAMKRMVDEIRNRLEGHTP